MGAFCFVARVPRHRQTWLLSGGAERGRNVRDRIRHRVWATVAPVYDRRARVFQSAPRVTLRGDCGRRNSHGHKNLLHLFRRTCNYHIPLSSKTGKQQRKPFAVHALSGGAKLRSRARRLWFAGAVAPAFRPARIAKVPTPLGGTGTHCQGADLKVGATSALRPWWFPQIVWRDQQTAPINRIGARKRPLFRPPAQVSANGIHPDIIRHRLPSLALAQNVIVRAMLPQPQAGFLFEGECGTLLENLCKSQKIRRKMSPVRQKVQVVRHEAVSLNGKAVCL